ncbi:MAG: nickel-responsive regulator [Candidatus Altiarchaeales archaeon IMC4]|nr:MAG: nickel-responsive regulator [Candidatus Altiarchaeales archaeon IMC4]
MTREKVTRIGVSLPSKLLGRFDELIGEKGYTARSEAIRDMIRDRLVEEKWKENENVAGTITLVYDHDKHNVTETLNDLQHSFCSKINSSTHVHMDEHNCLEVLIVRGKAKEVNAIAERLISQKGVKHGKLVMTTTGEGVE